MPIFEFKCSKCAKIFEKLSKTAEKSAECPKCGKKAEKIISSFNALGTLTFSKCSSAETCPSVGKPCCSGGTCVAHRR